MDQTRLYPHVGSLSIPCSAGLALGTWHLYGCRVAGGKTIKSELVLCCALYAKGEKHLLVVQMFNNTTKYCGAVSTGVQLMSKPQV